LVVYGRLVGTGEDSARALATLYDVANRRVISEFDLRDRSDRIDRLTDSLALRLMGDLSRNRPLGAWRLASLGSSSPAALKAFLRGEQHYRRFNLDSARVHYERAIELDSTFALAHSRRAETLGWDLYGEPEFVVSLLRAGELNRGLARRESLLLVSDSIWGALAYFRGDSSSWPRLQRLLPTLEYAVRQYPLDPQVWYELGEARYHFGPYLGVTDEQALAAFATAVELDSAFVPAYKHLIELTLLVEGASVARHVVEAYLAQAGSNPLTDAERVTGSLLDPDRARSTDVAGLLEALPANGKYQVWYDLKWWVDSAETATRVARVWAMTDSMVGRQPLALALAYRGRLGAAYEVAGRDWPALVGTLTRLGALPRDTAAAIYDGWLRSGDGPRIYIGLRWWLQERDSLSLQRAVALLDSLSAQAPPERSGIQDWLVRAGQAYLELVRGDTVTALRELEAIPNWPYSYWQYGPWLVRAQVLAAVGRDGEAASLLRQMPYTRQWAPPAEAVIVALERGRVNERLGNTEVAVRSFSYVVDAWRYADPHLQPLVEEARTALARLAGEPRSGAR
jgi:serine/threonine-protein kinase